MATARAPPLAARRSACRAASLFNGAMIFPSAAIRSSISMARFHKGGGRRAASENNSGRVWSPMSRASANPRVTQTAVLVAAPLQKGVGGDGRAHADFGNPFRRNARGGRELQHLSCGGESAVAVGGGRFGDMQAAVGRKPDDIGECPAAVNPKPPLPLARLHSRPFRRRRMRINKIAKKNYIPRGEKFPPHFLIINFAQMRRRNKKDSAENFVGMR